MIAIIIKSTVAVIVALLALGAARRSRASVRHLVLTALFVFLLLLPLAQRFGPAVEVPGAAVQRVEAIAAKAVPAMAGEKMLHGATADGGMTAAVGERSPRASGSWRVAAIATYGSVVALLLLYLAAGVVRLRRMERRGEVWLEGTARMNEIAAAAGIRRAALVIVSDEVAVPLTFGFRRSVIVVPRSAKEWSADELARALRHELEHVRREDWMLQLVARGVCALYWAHPMVWIAWRRFCFEAERACDDAVIAAGGGGDYAGQLVALARSVTFGPAVPALAMASRSRLAERVDALLDRSQRRGPLGGIATATACAATLVLLATLAPARLVSAAAVGEEVQHEQSRSAASVIDSVADEDGVDDAIREGVSGALAEAFIKSAERGRMDDVARLIAAGMDVNTVVRGDGTALIAAARAGQYEMALLLLDNGANVDLPVRGDGNPLIAAAAAGHAEIVELLLDRGAEIDLVVPGDENALIQAAWRGHADIVALLIGRGADLNVRVREGDEIRSAGRMAARAGHLHIVRMLRAAGARE